MKDPTLLDAVTPEMAVRLGKFCGNGPGLWLRLQQTYDLFDQRFQGGAGAGPGCHAGSGSIGPIPGGRTPFPHILVARR